MNRKLMASAMILTMGIGAATPVWAGEDHDNIGLQHDPVPMRMASTHTMSMVDAIKKVEKFTHGLATSVWSTTENGALIYKMDVKKPDGTERVSINTETGMILTM